MKLFLFLGFIVTLTITAGHSSGQTAVMPNRYKDLFIGSFRSGVFVPPSYETSKKYPLVIYLHGKGDTLSRDLAWYHIPATIGDPAIVLTPKCPLSETREWGNSWSSDEPPMIQKTLEMIELVRGKYAIDPNRMYIYGISMGAIGTFGLIQRHPSMFAAGYAICGWGDPAAAPQLSRLPFWLFHGANDDVVPVEGSRGIYKATLAFGGKQIHYTEFKNVKHDAQNYVNNKEIIAWMLSKRKNRAQPSGR